MDNTLQNVVAPFNIKAYGLVNRLLQNYVPISWAIRSGKPKDGVDFSAPAFRMAPSATGTATLNFAGGPFLIHRAYTNLAIPHITAFGNNVAVYQLTADVVVDIRHELRFRPSLSVNSVNSSIHTDLLDFAGINSYTVTSDYNLSSNTCFTLFLEPHNGATTGVPSARKFIESGGNFLAECLAVDTYENDPGGHFQSTSYIETGICPTASTSARLTRLPAARTRIGRWVAACSRTTAMCIWTTSAHPRPIMRQPPPSIPWGRAGCSSTSVAIITALAATTSL
jgi:hypothetical protein